MAKFKPAPTPKTPLSRAESSGDTARPPMDTKKFDKAGLPEGLRPAYGLGKPKISKPLGHLAADADAPPPMPLSTSPKPSKPKPAKAKSTRQGY